METAAKHILIAEDEKHLRLTYELILAKEGFQVTVTNNGLEALFLLLKSQKGTFPCIDLVITDVRMPKIDGLQLIEKLHDEAITIPLIVVTGYGNNALIEELRRKGCTACLNKPFTAEELLEMVQKTLPQMERL